MIGLGWHKIEEDLAEINLEELDGVLHEEFLIEFNELDQLLENHAELARRFPEQE